MKIFHDFKIGFPDPAENVQQLVPLFFVGFEPVFIAPVPVKRLIEHLIIFRPVQIGNEIIYKTDYTFFKHLN